MRLAEARLEEREVVVERVGVRRNVADLLGAVTPPAEARAIAVVVADRLEARALLDPPRVERGIDVDEIDRSVRKLTQDVEALGLDDAVQSFAKQ